MWLQICLLTLALCTRVETFSAARFGRRLELRHRCRGLRMVADDRKLPEDGDLGSFGRGAMGVLQRRITTLRDKIVERDRVTARNWRNGVMQHYLLDAVEEVRGVALAGALMAYGTRSGAAYVTLIDKDAMAMRSQATEEADAAMEIYAAEDDDEEDDDEEELFYQYDDDLFGTPLKYKVAGYDAEVTSIAFDGKWLAMGYQDGALAVFDVYDPEEPIFCIADAHAGMRVTGISFVPFTKSIANAKQDAADGSEGASEGKSDANDVDASGGQNSTTTTPGPSVVQRIATTGLDARVRLWNFQEGACETEKHLPSPAACIACADGYLVAGLMDGRVTIHAEGLKWRPVLAVAAHNCSVRSVFFDRQDRLLTGGANGIVKYWNLNPDVDLNSDNEDAGEEVRLKAHEGAVVAMQADDSKVVTASVDGTIRVWPLSAMRSGDVEGLLPQFSIEGKRMRAGSE
mmetsp:Transcript_1397/g.6000  ORF Transcript_1397/g.6000 Transcript_1397/m.6000 type:complete len:459 (-) Transcript_1397:2716-4092(-)